MRPRVVFVNHCARLSGGELALVRLLAALGDAVDAHVVLAEPGPLVGRLERAGVETAVLPLRSEVLHTPRTDVTLLRPPVRQAAATAAYALRLGRLLRRLRPDLIHANSLKSLVYGGLAGRLARVPVVWHVRDRIARDYLPAAAVELVGALARVLPGATIANSHETLRTLDRASRGRTTAKPHAVVYDPLGTPPPAMRSADGAPLGIGMVGRIAPWKGQHVFLKAFSASFADGDERAVVIGAPLFGEERYEQELRDLVQELGLEQRVEFTGFRDDVARELARLDVLVHASLVPEPLGQVVQEGMQAGLPVVAAGAGGPVEIVDDGVTGFLYPPGDSAALAARLKTLAHDAPMRSRVGDAARERAEAFAPERVAPQVLSLYRELLAA
jgi:glycosyltransferase involved in cell wall biosynthesis